MYSLQKYSVLPVFAICAAIIFSCNPSKATKKELPEEKFRAILVDVFMAEAYITEESTKHQFNPASLMNRKIYPVILEKHGVSEQAFLNTYEYYLHKHDDFRDVLAIVQDTLNLILEKAPMVTSELPPPPVTEKPIESDSALAEDAMNRFRLLEQKKQGQKVQDKKSN